MHHLTFNREHLKVNVVKPGKLWVVDKPWPFVVEGEWFLVPAGFLTDLASIPWFARWLFPKRGPYDAEAVIHDFLIVTKDMHNIPSEVVHRIWHDSVKLLPINRFRKFGLGWAVRLFGPRWH